MSHVDLDPNRTIVAIASALGPAPRGIVRLSGPQTLDCLNRICNPACEVPAGPRCFATTLRIIGISIPVAAKVLYWPDRRSYTRQPSAEVHVSGSPPVIQALVESLCQNGATLARPGEFTLRAFLAGRIDLSQAEAVLSAVEASSESEFAFALAQNAGGLRNPLDRLRQELLELLAHLEAGLDFVEEDIQFISRSELKSSLQRILMTLQEINQQLITRNVSNDGWRIALIGRPNAGKSSLFNALVGRAAAIANEVAGTTRDYLVESLKIGGFVVQLADTAGLIPSDLSSATELGAQPFSIHEWAQVQTRQLIAQTHLEILCVERGLELSAWERVKLYAGGERMLHVLTKSDLGLGPPPSDGIPVSAQTGDGLADLRLRIGERLTQLSARPGACSPTVARCSESLVLATTALHRAAEVLHENAGDEIIAAELRSALDELGCIVGAVYTDDILDQIFSRFCIGK